ncbi:MAG: YbaB/EbfC family nucleoid-associated protein [Spirochaetota bacterium]
MNIADMMEMLRNPQALAARAEELKRMTDAIEATGSAGGGMVKITVNGSMAIKSCIISPEVVDPDDVQMLQDLVIAAFNDAQSHIKESLQRSLAENMGGMGLPPGLFGGLG